MLQVCFFELRQVSCSAMATRLSGPCRRTVFEKRGHCGSYYGNFPIKNSALKACSPSTETMSPFCAELLKPSVSSTSAGRLVNRAVALPTRVEVYMSLKRRLCVHHHGHGSPRSQTGCLPDAFNLSMPQQPMICTTTTLMSCLGRGCSPSAQHGLSCR